MSSTLVDYKGLQVPDPTAPNLGGTAIQNNFTKTVDWNPASVWDRTTDPGANDDINAGFYPGSRWLNTMTTAVWTCVDNTAGAAVWTEGGGSSTPAGADTQVQFNDSGSFGADADFTFNSATGLLSVTGAVLVDNLKLDGNTLSSSDTNGPIILSPNGTGTVQISAVAITGGSITGITDLAIADGGTGASTASGARTNLGLGTIATQDASSVSITGGTINGATVTGLPAPSAASDATTKSYVDATVQGLQVKPTAAAATTAALAANTYNNGSSGVGATLTANSNGALTVDGYAVAASDLVLVKNESSASRNGLYTVTQTGDGSHPYILTRHADMDQSAEFPGAFVPVGNAGTTNANSLWLANPSTPVTVGTTAIPFTQLNGATDLIAGTGISISGNTVSINTSWVGQTAITTLGTITTGTWQGTAVGIAYGGTGAITAAAALDNLAGVTINGSAYVIPTRTNSATTNGTNLLAAYTAAKALTPFGSALSATNRAAVLLLPGKYDLGTGSLTLDTQFVDLIGVAAPENVVITSACNGASTGTVKQTADDVLIQAVTLICTSTSTRNNNNTDPAAYFSNTALTNAKLRWVNITATNNGWGMRLATEYKGTYADCTHIGDNGFGGLTGTASGTFTHCIHTGDFGFGGDHGIASGVFTNCTHTGFGGFGQGPGTGTASGIFTACVHTGDKGFGGEGTASGKFINCIHTGDYGFGGDGGLASGTFIGCLHTGTSGFGGSGSASGTFTSCTNIGNGGFGGNGGIASGTFNNCTNTGTAGFGGTAGTMSGVMFNCASAGQFNANVSGRIENCRIVATGTNQTAITNLASNAILKDCVLVATGTGKCFDASSAVNLKIYGLVMTNAAKGSNVTIIAGGSLVVDSNVT